MSSVGRILIAGAGIAGLTVAAALHRRGLDAELVERSAHWDAVGAGIAVQPNGLRVLRELGMGPAVERAGAVVRDWQFRDQRGDVLCRTDLETIWGEVGPMIGIERAALQEVLCAGAGAVPCRLGTWVTSLRQTDRCVSVEFSDGGAGQYDLVIGADGIFSTVRTMELDAAPPVYGGQMAWRGLAPTRPRELNGVQFWLGEGCFFGLCPVRDALAYGFGIVTTPRLLDAASGRLERLRRRFAGFGGLVGDYLASLRSDEQIHCGPIEWLDLDRWHAGRVVLIGDAAHASSPMMGQGGSMAMEDAWVLAGVLQSAVSVEEARRLFDARRRPHVDWVHQQSRAVGELLRMPPDTRNAILRERGPKALHDRFRPLAATPWRRTPWRMGGAWPGDALTRGPGLPHDRSTRGAAGPSTDVGGRAAHWAARQRCFDNLNEEATS
jgi:2-polyprenyl-6-methoxyphenol hydroxylase-like FAD-dependent oxidoreductase